MKLLRKIFLDWVAETELFEMATARKQARRFVASLAAPIVEQFLKLIYLDSPNDYHHWIQDGIDNYLHQIQDIILSENNKRPDPNDYYIWLFDDLFTLNESTVTSRFRRLRIRYPDIVLKKEFNATEIVLDIEHLFNPKISKLLYDISAGKFDTIVNYYSFDTSLFRQI